MADDTPRPGASQPPDAKQQANELRELLQVEMIEWPVANPRQQVQDIAVLHACTLIQDTLEWVASGETERRERLRVWQVKHGALPVVLAALVPGIAAQLKNREAIVGELLEVLARLQANFEIDDARDSLLNNLATFAAIAAGEVPRG